MSAMDIDTAHALSLDIASFVGRSTALLGITGTGKTNTAAVLVEELLSAGLPMTIVDIEGEYWGLKERFDILVAGRSEHAELAIGPEHAAQLAELSVQRGISVILDLSGYSDEEMYALLIAYFQRLWDTASHTKKPYQIVLEEAHEWIPQGTRTPLKQLLTRIALRGRKRGLGIILISQRSAKVEKDVLTQVPLLFLHQVVHPIDIKVYQDLIPLPPEQVKEMVSTLKIGEVVVLSQHHPAIAQIRPQHTFHAGTTPTLGENTEPAIRHIDAALLKELQTALKSESAATPKNREKQLERRVNELERQLALKEAEIARQQEEIASLSRRSVEVASPHSLDIHRAEVRQIVTSATPAAGAVTPAARVSTQATKPATVRTEQPPLNERKFASYARRLASVPRRQRQILHLLTEKDRLMSVQDMAAWLQVEESSISKNPPNDLLRLRLISRVKERGSFHYRSDLRAALAQEFPGADVEALVHRLLG